MLSSDADYTQMTAKQIVPRDRPGIDEEDAIIMAAAMYPNAPKDCFFLLGRRGYFANTLGDTPLNERGIYDDAIIFVTPTAYKTFNANVDPTIFRESIATLKPGVWMYELGIHNKSKDPVKHPHYEALVQAAEVEVYRDLKDGKGAVLDRGYFGINIHRGGYNTTSSEGCQTIHPDQWGEFIGLVRSEMQRHNKKVVPYVLTER